MTVSKIRTEMRDELKHILSGFTEEQTKEFCNALQLTLAYIQIAEPGEIGKLLAAADGLNKLEKNGVSVSFAFGK